jgi:hypothetical protein
LLLLDGYLTQEEAKINDRITQRIDFENPSKDMVCGLPGYYRPVDRVKQLEMVKNRFQHNDRLKENPV